MGFRERVSMGDMYDGPVARIALPGARRRAPGLHRLQAGGQDAPAGPVSFEIIKARTEPYSGLQVKYDPGVWFIWVGCTLMVLGLFHRLLLQPPQGVAAPEPTGKGRTKVEMAGSHQQEPPGPGRLISPPGHELGG